MAETPSTMILEPGDRAPDFTLPDGAGNRFSLSEIAGGGTALVVAFVCNHCPFVIHLAEEFTKFVEDYEPEGVRFVAINSNDVENYPDDSPEKMVEFAEKYGWNFPYLYDEDQEVAKLYSAACTPDFYIFDGDLRLTYRGQFDDSRPRGDRSKKEITGDDMRYALDQTIEGEPLGGAMFPSTGCNIKWKAGNEPAYFG